MLLPDNPPIALRALEPEDLDCLYRWENDPELWQHGSTLAPYSRFMLRNYIETAQSQDPFQARQVRLMVVENASRQPVGTIDLYDLDSLHCRAGVGVFIEAAHRNRGWGQEALRLLHAYAAGTLLLHQLYACVPKNNDSSFHMLRNSGYETVGLLKAWLKTGEGYQDAYLMQHLLSAAP
jgi:diamine N-acetyltransferase